MWPGSGSVLIKLDRFKNGKLTVTCNLPFLCYFSRTRVFECCITHTKKKKMGGGGGIISDYSALLFWKERFAYLQVSFNKTCSAVSQLRAGGVPAFPCTRLSAQVVVWPQTDRDWFVDLVECESNKLMQLVELEEEAEWDHTFHQPLLVK